MAVAVALVVGFLAGRLSWLLLRPLLADAVFARQNFRGHTLPTAAGLVVVVAVLAVEAARVVAGVAVDAATGDAAPTRAHEAIRGAVVLVVVGLGFLGLVDDLAGHGDARGFRGHVRSLASGRLTTGGLKLVGGAAVALVAVAMARPGSTLWTVLPDAALVALAANLGNLLDRAPGRVIKATAVAFAAVLVALLAARSPVTERLAAPAVVVGAALAVVLDDLHERMMLGDTGANVLGGVVGLAVVVTASPGIRLVVLAVVVALNLASEWVSFSRVIDGFAPLRAIDRSGRRER